VTYRVDEADGAWWVMRTGERVAGPYTNAEAWAWVDRHSEEDDGADACNRIRQAFNGSYRPDRY
jgi:hypothetical protein